MDEDPDYNFCGSDDPDFEACDFNEEDDEQRTVFKTKPLIREATSLNSSKNGIERHFLYSERKSAACQKKSLA